MTSNTSADASLAIQLIRAHGLALQAELGGTVLSVTELAETFVKVIYSAGFDSEIRVGCINPDKGGDYFICDARIFPEEADNRARERLKLL